MSATTVGGIERAREMLELGDDKLEALASEGGPDAKIAREVLEGRAKERSAPDPPPEPDELVVDGTTQLELFDFGGKRPTGATIKFNGGKVRIVAGEAFSKGDRIKFEGEAIVNVVSQKDEHDAQTGQVVDCEQRHEARIIDLQVVSASA